MDGVIRLTFHPHNTSAAKPMSYSELKDLQSKLTLFGGGEDSGDQKRNDTFKSVSHVLMHSMMKHETYCYKRANHLVAA